MKIKLFVDSGANIHSTKSTVIEVDDEDWASMTDEEKEKVAQEWADEQIQVWYEELS